MSDYEQSMQGVGRALHSFMAVILAVAVAFAFSSISATQFAYADGECTVTFDTDGGSTIDPQTVNAGEKATEPANPTKANSIFEGWYTEDGTRFNFDDPVDKSITLTAKWADDKNDDKIADKYQATIKFEVVNGYWNEGEDDNEPKVEVVTFMKDDEPAEDGTATLTTPAVGNKPAANYTTGSWNPEILASITKNDPTEYIYTYALQQFTVTFDTDGGSVVEAQKVNANGKATEPNPAPTKSGYTFEGWYNGDAKYDFDTTVTGNITLTAKWKEDSGESEKTFTVTFDSAGGSAVAAQTVKEGGKAIQPAPPTRTGYKFKGWLLGTTPYDFSTAVTSDITLTASWEADPVTYTVTFDPAGGSAVAAQTVESGKTATAPTEPTKSGYTFEGWTLNGKAYDFKTPVTGNITLKASWKAVTPPAPTTKTFTVTFNSDGGSAVKAQSVKEGAKATEPTAPTKSGYTFEGWTLNGKTYDFKTPVTSNITLKATWKAVAAATKTYTVTFDTDGGSTIKAQSVKDGSKATKPADPTKEGYTFEGWTLNGKDYDFKTAVTGNITLKASWKAEEKTGDWKQSGNRWWYEYSDGTYPKNEWLQINGKYYHFDSAGWMQTGWLQIDQSVNNAELSSKKWFYLDPSGSAHAGWLLSGGTWYYLLPASDTSVIDGQYTMVASSKKGEFVVKTIKGNEYCFASSGAMGKGWIKDGISWFYYDNSGAQVSSKWILSNGKWYWLDQYGVMATSGWVDGDKYYVNSSGVMLTGWSRVAKNSDKEYTTDISGAPAWYYFKPSGAVVKNDWVFSGGKWYWLTDDGSMAQEEFITTKNKEYYFNANGVMVTGWKQRSDTWYYFKNSGEKVVSNWVQSSGKWYWMNDEGVMVTSKWIKDGEYYLDANGVMVTGWKRIDENSDKNPTRDKDGGYAWYYFNKSGFSIRNNWVKGGSNWYWLTGDGTLAEDQWVDYGKYYVNDKGVWLPDYKKDSETADEE